MNKSICTLLIIIFTIFLFGSTSAQDFDFDTPTVQYGDSVELTVDCQPESECQASGDPTAAGLYIDGYNVATEASSGGAFSTPLLEWPITFEFDVPGGMNDGHLAPLNTGDYVMEVQIEGSTSDGPSGTGSPFTVEAKNMDDHVGENMIVNKRIDHAGQDTPELRNFQITNDVWDYNTGIATDDSVVIMVQNYDAGGGFPLDGSNLFGVYEVQPTDNPNDNVLSYSDSNIWEWVERVQYTEVRNDEVQIYDARSVLEETFTSGNLFEYGDVEGSSSWQISSQSPLHDSGNFLLDGEVALGYYPYHYDEDGDLVDPDEGRRDSPDLYVCREGAEMDNGFGDSVSQIVDVTEDEDDFNPLRCNRNTGTWADVGECDVRIDTIGNELLNNNIPAGGCEDDPPKCEAGEAYYDGDMFYACYDDGSGNIVEEPYSDWDIVEPNNEEIFAGYGPMDAMLIEFTCDADSSPSCISGPATIGSDSWRSTWQNYGTMNYVEYGAWPSYLVSESPRAGIAHNDPWDSKFVTDTGGWTAQIQSLEEAEELYGGSQDLDDASTWDGMNMTNTGNSGASTIYYGDDAEEYHEAWTTAHAGRNDEPISGDSDNFQGGFAGECGENKWTYMGDEDFAENDWMCDGATVEDDGGSSGGTTFDVVTIPGFENTAFLPDTEINNDEREIGVVLFPFLNMDLSERQSQLSTDLNSEIVDPYYTQLSDANGEVEGVTVNCWAGRLDDKPETATGEFDHNSDRAFSGEASMPSGNQLWSVSDTVDTDLYSGYACEWWYDVTDFSEKARGEEGDVAHVHRDGNLQDMIESEYSSFQEEGFP